MVVDETVWEKCVHRGPAVGKEGAHQLGLERVQQRLARGAPPTSGKGEEGVQGDPGEEEFPTVKGPPSRHALRSGGS